VKYAIVAFLTALLVGFGVVAYFKGWLPTLTFNKPQAVSVQNTEVLNPPVATPALSPSASPSAGFTVVKAGGVLVFKAYSIEVPSDWTYTREAAPTAEVALDKLTLTKGIYKISIYQAATGGAPCLYPGDPDQEGPSSRYTSFVPLTAASGEKLRRSSNDGVSGFTVCELQSGGYGQPTTFGHISVVAPAVPAQSTVDQIDAMLSSLKKI
jgi:hypothetical protein